MDYVEEHGDHLHGRHPEQILLQALDSVPGPLGQRQVKVSSAEEDRTALLRVQ